MTSDLRQEADALAAAEPASNRWALVLGAAVLWTLVVIFGWLLQPRVDHLIVGVDAANERVKVEIQCEAPIEGSGRDVSVALPPLDDGQAFPHEPCAEQYTEVVVVLASNVIFVGVLVATALWMRRRERESADES